MRTHTAHPSAWSRPGERERRSDGDCAIVHERARLVAAAAEGCRLAGAGRALCYDTDVGLRVCSSNVKDCRPGVRPPQEGL